MDFAIFIKKYITKIVGINLIAITNNDDVVAKTIFNKTKDIFAITTVIITSIATLRILSIFIRSQLLICKVHYLQNRLF